MSKEKAQAFFEKKKEEAKGKMKGKDDEGSDKKGPDMKNARRPPETLRKGKK